MNNLYTLSFNQNNTQQENSTMAKITNAYEITMGFRIYSWVYKLTGTFLAYFWLSISCNLHGSIP